MRNWIVSWKPGKEQSYKVSAQKIADEIASVKFPTPETIIDMAKDENTEIHKLIEWDNDVAAEEYRRKRVIQIMGDLQIEHSKQKEKVWE